MSIDLSSIEKRIPELRIRAFRAIDDFESCKRFRSGHLGVLEAFGFKLSSASEEWMFDKKTYVIVIESPDGSHIYGGSRLQFFGPGLELPIKSALKEDIPELSSFLESFSPPIVELCGLWNSVAVAGLGIGSIYSIRSALALAGILEFQSVVALCSAYTYRISHKYGFNLVEDLADNGKIFYEGANQYAHITLQNDVRNMLGADELERQRIFEIRDNPKAEFEEIIGDGLSKINYMFEI
jgi:hypothetical protein